jgi:hypothetical protein
MVLGNHQARHFQNQRSNAAVYHILIPTRVLKLSPEIRLNLQNVDYMFLHARNIWFDFNFMAGAHAFRWGSVPEHRFAIWVAESPRRSS